MEPDEKIAFKAKSLSPPSNGSLSIHALSKLYCPASITAASADSLPRKTASQQFTALSGLFTVVRPYSWNNAADLDLTISIDHSVFRSQTLPEDSSSIYLWNSSGSRWDKITSTISRVGDSLRWSTKITVQGTYAVLIPSPVGPAVSSGAVYPTVARLSAGMPVHVSGTGVNEFRVYAMDGALVAHVSGSDVFYSSHNEVSTLDWNLTNSKGKKIMPGIYHVIATIINSETATKKIFRQKILVTP
jgi:hypothetical protein